MKLGKPIPHAAKGKTKPMAHKAVDTNKAKGAMPMAPAHGSEDHYRARDAMETLRRAEEIKADPKLMGHVKTMAASQIGHLKKIKGRA